MRLGYTTCYADYDFHRYFCSAYYCTCTRLPHGLPFCLPLPDTTVLLPLQPALQSMIAVSAVGYCLFCSRFPRYLRYVPASAAAVAVHAAAAAALAAPRCRLATTGSNALKRI